MTQNSDDLFELEPDTANADVSVEEVDTEVLDAPVAEQPPEPPAPPAEPEADPGTADDGHLGPYAEWAYLEYAMSVVRSRAIPDAADGQKPVQRRILYAMRELGLNPGGKHVKSARVVGDVIGKFHPHGDSSVYEAMVRVAQDFSLRYPLVDGQGNFGSRDGDSAAAMRYTEARLAPIAELLLSELDEGTVDFKPNYDGEFREPAMLPARLPMMLANGASGIAVGMATEIPSHNLRELAAAAVQVLRHPASTIDDLLPLLPGPDFPGGGQIVSPAEGIRTAYTTGRGSLRVRARWQVEAMARGQWRVIVEELPPGVSTRVVLEKLEEKVNPRPKEGKKTLDQEQSQTKALLLSVLDRVRDESDKDNPVRLVLEPKSSRQSADEFMAVLLAHLPLEVSAPINLVAIDNAGRPRSMTLVELLQQWCEFRLITVRRRSEHRLGKALDRIHILEGRQTILLNIDEVIRIIRESDDPKAALIARFKLSDRQAEDILEIRLRQLARLEAIKIEQELAKLMAERDHLEGLLGDPGKLQKLVIKEIEADAAKYGDERRTLIEAAERVKLETTVADEPVTVLISAKGWARTRQGHNLDLSAVSFKEGDSLRQTIECRTPDSLVLLLTNGRACTVPVATLPGGKSEGVPLLSLIDAAGAKIAQIFTGQPEQRFFISQSAGYGFLCKFGDMLARNRNGKSFITLEEGSEPLPPRPVTDACDHLAALTTEPRLLVFPLAEMKELSGGKGVQVMQVPVGMTLADSLPIIGNVVRVIGEFRGKEKEDRSSDAHYGRRAKRGALIGAGLKKMRLAAVEPKPGKPAGEGA
jgi:topoisomerase-4 subunit A